VRTIVVAIFGVAAAAMTTSSPGVAAAATPSSPSPPATAGTIGLRLLDEPASAGAVGVRRATGGPVGDRNRFPCCRLGDDVDAFRARSLMPTSLMLGNVETLPHHMPRSSRRLGESAVGELQRSLSLLVVERGRHLVLCCLPKSVACGYTAPL
jgi:hypothetical protein